MQNRTDPFPKKRPVCTLKCYDAWDLHAPSDRLPFICIHLGGEKHGEKNCLIQEHNTMTLLLELEQLPYHCWGETYSLEVTLIWALLVCAAPKDMSFSLFYIK